VEKEDREIIRHISDTLDEVLAFLKKPENKIMKVLEVVSTVMGVLAIIGIIDMIRNWFFGG